MKEKNLDENNKVENENNQDLSLNNQIHLFRTFNSNKGHSSALKRRNMNENNPSLRNNKNNNYNK